MKKYSPIIFAIFLSGCVTQYQPNGIGGGYYDMQFNKDTYKVSYRGNAYTSRNRLQALLLKRCAQLTLNNGYKYFIILAGREDDNAGYFSTPTRIVSNGYGNGSGYGNYGYGQFQGNYNNYYHSNTTVYGGQTYRMDKLTENVVIKMLPNNKNYPMAF